MTHIHDGSRRDLAADAAELHRLHQPGRPLVLPNVWDVAGARLVQAAGFRVVATSSVAVARSLGFDDDDTMPPEEAFGALARIARSVSTPVTADIEAGYRLPPQDLVRRLLEAGAVGCNLEDTDHHGDAELVDTDAQAAFLASVKEAARGLGVDVVVNARVDVFRHGHADEDAALQQAISRAAAYLEAGADCVYPIRLSDETRIARFVDQVQAPVNIMLSPATPTPTRLAELGVARISLANHLMEVAYRAVAGALDDLGRATL